MENNPGNKKKGNLVGEGGGEGVVWKYQYLHMPTIWEKKVIPYSQQEDWQRIA